MVAQSSKAVMLLELGILYETLIRVLMSAKMVVTNGLIRPGIDSDGTT